MSPHGLLFRIPLAAAPAVQRYLRKTSDRRLSALRKIPPQPNSAKNKYINP
jgi:hypothetical protein